jgi:hypothetical protein
MKYRLQQNQAQTLLKVLNPELNTIQNPQTDSKISNAKQVERKQKKSTFVEAWVVRTAVQPSPTVNSHEIESPCTQ